MGEIRNAHNVLVGKPQGKRPLEKSRRICKSIRIDLRETVKEGMDWFHLAQNRNHWRNLVNTVMNLWFP
jgi:hypothetical protein